MLYFTGTLFSDFWFSWRICNSYKISIHFTFWRFLYSSFIGHDLLSQKRNLKHCKKKSLGECNKDGVRLLPVLPSDRKRGSEHKWKCRRFSLNTRNHFLLCGWQSNVIGCSQSLWSSFPCTSSQVTLIRSWATCNYLKKPRGTVSITTKNAQFYCKHYGIISLSNGAIL